MTKLSPILLVCLAVGCGAAEESAPPRIVELVTVRDSQGGERQIPSAELHQAVQGEPPVTEILVIDRQTNRKRFVDLDQIPSSTQNVARYIPATTSQAVSDSGVE